MFLFLLCLNYIHTTGKIRWHLTCSITIDTHFDHLMTVLAASLLHCKITVLVPCVINKNAVERILETL